MNTPTKPVEQKARELLIEQLLSIARFGNDQNCHIEVNSAMATACLKAVAALNTDEERIRREAFEEAAKVADNLDAGVVAYHIRSLSTPSKGVG